jgi:hypothetical protein
VFEKDNICVSVSLLPLVWMMRKGIGAYLDPALDDDVVASLFFRGSVAV